MICDLKSLIAGYLGGSVRVISSGPMGDFAYGRKDIESVIYSSLTKRT